MASHPFLLSQPQKKKNPTKIKHKYEPHLKPTNPKDLKRPPNTQHPEFHSHTSYQEMHDPFNQDNKTQEKTDLLNL